MGAGEVEAEGPDQCVIVPASIQLQGFNGIGFANALLTASDPLLG
jgi:hypothetical protein